THGTGTGYGCLSTFVTELELVTGTGEMLRCSASVDPDLFQAALVGLGAVGVVTEVTLSCVDACILLPEERPTPLPDVLDGLDTLVAGNDHVEFYWMPYTERALTKANNRVERDSRPRGRFATWFNDYLLENTVIGGVCRLSRAMPTATPLLLRATARFFNPRVYTERSDVVFTSPRQVRFVEM